MEENDFVSKPKIGKCAICLMEGFITYHHLVHKRFNIHTNATVKLFWVSNNGRLHFLNAPCKIENLMIPLCEICHATIHPENLKFQQYAIEKNKALVTGEEFVPPRCKNCVHVNACRRTDYACDYFSDIAVEIEDLKCQARKY